MTNLLNLLAFILVSKAAAAADLSFTKEVALQDKKLSVDAKGFKPAPCSATRNPPTEVGRLPIAEGVTAKIICIDDYDGGFLLTYPSRSGQSKSLELSELSGDAGDQWDRRAWIQKDPDRGVLFLIVTASSNTDTDTGELINCTFSAKQYSWSGVKGEVVEGSLAKPFSPASFGKPIGVDRRCLNADGGWKGLPPK